MHLVGFLDVGVKILPLDEECVLRAVLQLLNISCDLSVHNRDHLIMCSMYLVGFLEVGATLLTLDEEFALCVLRRLNNGCNLAVHICDHLIDCSMRLVGFIEVGVANLIYKRDLHSELYSGT